MPAAADVRPAGSAATRTLTPRTALCGFLPHHRRRHADRLRVSVPAARGRPIRTISRRASCRIRPRRARYVRTRLAKALPSTAAITRSITARATSRRPRLRRFVGRPPGTCAARLARPGRSRAARAAPPTGGRPGCAASHRRGTRLPAELLHGALLLGEWNPLYRRRRAAAKEMHVFRTARHIRHRAVRVPQIRAGRRHRQLAAHQPGIMNLCPTHTRDAAKPTLPEIRCGNR